MARNAAGLCDDGALHLYAVADALPPSWRPPREGVTGRPVLAWLVEQLAVIASPLVAPLTRTPSAVAQHHEVIASLLEARCVLPLSFGASLAGSELKPWLESHWSTIQAALAELRGCVEMTVRLVRLEPAGASGSTAASLRAFAERLVERAERDQWRYLPCGSGANLGATLAFLVPRGDVPDLLARIAPLASRAAGLAVVPSGPWPPYSFAPALEVDAVRGRRELLPVARAG